LFKLTESQLQKSEQVPESGLKSDVATKSTSIQSQRSENTLQAAVLASLSRLDIKKLNPSVTHASVNAVK